MIVANRPKGWLYRGIYSILSTLRLVTPTSTYKWLENNYRPLRFRMGNSKYVAQISNIQVVIYVDNMNEFVISYMGKLIQDKRFNNLQDAKDEAQRIHLNYLMGLFKNSIENG